MDDLPGDRFVTFAAAKLSPPGTLEVYSAGHGPLVLRRTDGAVDLLAPHTFPLGITSELVPGEEVTVRRLMPGDTLLMFSDGVTEIRNPQGQLWNMDGLLKCLPRHQDICGRDLLREIDHENIMFADGETPADDRTMVVAAFRGTLSGT